MADPALLTRLAQHRALSTAPANERAWLAEHGVLHAFAVGDVITRKGEQATALTIVLSGHLVIRVDRHGRPLRGGEEPGAPARGPRAAGDGLGARRPFDPARDDARRIPSIAGRLSARVPGHSRSASGDRRHAADGRDETADDGIRKPAPRPRASRRAKAWSWPSSGCPSHRQPPGRPEVQ